MLKDWEESLNKDLKLAYLPSPGVVRLRLSGISNDKSKIKSLIKSELVKLNLIVKYDDNKSDLNKLVYDLCTRKKISISVAESCTSGLIASSLSQIPGSSSSFLGGIICYSDLSKINQRLCPNYFRRNRLSREEISNQAIMGFINQKCH